ncbi:MAG: tetratricopeptide repeat protein [Alphaproteobacteria bacterium]|nr:tetratricopeptide repeat protein [Alphaproteobacteria bacterium]
MGTQDAITLHAMGAEAYRAGRLAEAAALIEQAIAADGRMPDFHYNLGIVLKAQGKLRDAAASYQRAIALKPDYGDAHNNLGSVWKALGQTDKARASFEEALRCRPGHAGSHYNLGIICAGSGDAQRAASHFRHCLDADPDDSHGARILLAQLGVGPAPLQTPPAHLLKLYGARAQFWDTEIYFGARLVADALQAHAARDVLDILDIGCGTGLLGAIVRPLAARLDGVDLSPAMLEKAIAKGVYDGLYQGELAGFLSGRPRGYDAILGAATLIHFGDLTPIFQAAAAGLRDRGLFIFTLFPTVAGTDDFAVAANPGLAQSGCFAHSPGYVRRVAAASGFAVEALEDVIHEHDPDGNPVPGLLNVLRAP